MVIGLVFEKKERKQKKKQNTIVKCTRVGCNGGKKSKPAIYRIKKRATHLPASGDAKNTITKQVSGTSYQHSLSAIKYFMCIDQLGKSETLSWLCVRFVF